MNIVKVKSAKLKDSPVLDKPASLSPPESENKVLDILGQILKAITGRKRSSKVSRNNSVIGKESAANDKSIAPSRIDKPAKKAPPRKPVSVPKPVEAKRVVVTKASKSPAPSIIQPKKDNESPVVVSPSQVVSKENSAPVAVASSKKNDEDKPRGESGRYVSKNGAAEAQEKRREKVEKKAEQNDLKNTLDTVANAVTGGSAAVDAIAESSAADAAGTTVAGEDWKAGKELYEAIKEGRQGAVAAKEKWGDFKTSQAEKKKIRAEKKAKKEADKKAAKAEKEKLPKGGDNGFSSFKKLFHKLSLKDRKQNKKASKAAIEAVEDQTQNLEKVSESESKDIVKAIEDNATVVEGSGGFSMDKKLGKAGSALSKFVKVAGAPLAGVIAGGMKYSEVKDDETLSAGQKTAQVASTGGGALAGAMAGGATGAAIGSAIPVVGTVIGGLIGTAIGGYLGSKGGEVVGEAISDQMDGPEPAVASRNNKRDEKPTAIETIAALQNPQLAESKTSQVKSSYTPAQAITAPKLIKPRENQRASSNKSELDPRTGLPKSQQNSDAIEAKKISEPIVKAIDKLAKQSGSDKRDAYESAHIPTEFNSELLTLMVHDKL